MCEKPGGKEEFNREYRQWKCILQTVPKKRKRNLKTNPKSALAKVDRLGEQASVDWSFLGATYDSVLGSSVYEPVTSQVRIQN